ncbi:hypothetical protein TNCV_3185321 [Trichonephila clavipes]|nr:hypothetical protein TNCV_3185321 [Trichonephila clavipes]
MTSRQLSGVDRAARTMSIFSDGSRFSLGADDHPLPTCLERAPRPSGPIRHLLSSRHACNFTRLVTVWGGNLLGTHDHLWWSFKGTLTASLPDTWTIFYALRLCTAMHASSHAQVPIYRWDNARPRTAQTLPTIVSSRI